TLTDNQLGTDPARSTLQFQIPLCIGHQAVPDRYGFLTRGDGWGELLRSLPARWSARYLVMLHAPCRYRMNRLFRLQLSTTMGRGMRLVLRHRLRCLCPNAL